MPLLAPDVDSLVLEFCGALELGRCAAASTGLRAAASVTWKAVATTRFPLLASIARAAGGTFGYASAYRSQLKCLEEGVAPPLIHELEDLAEWSMGEGALANIVVTYTLHTRRELPPERNRYGMLEPRKYGDEPPHFVWSGRLSVQTPNLWTREQMPTEVRECWDATEVRGRVRYPPDGPNRMCLRIYLTEDSKTILLYGGEVTSGRNESPELEFSSKVAPLSPRLTNSFSHRVSSNPDDAEELDPSEVCLSIEPHMDVWTGRFALKFYLRVYPYGMDTRRQEHVEPPADLVLRHIASLNIGAMDAADYWSDYNHEPLWR